MAFRTEAHEQPARDLRLGATPARWAGLDGLRAVAVVATMAFHLGRPELRGGYLGVDVFFVLSGFLITDLLITDVERHGRVRMGRFYLRRALRLLPALVTVCAVTTVVCLAGPGHAWRDATLRGLAPVLLYVGNWPRAFGTPQTLGLLSHTWSLAVEEQFYLLWPWVVGLLARQLGTRRRPAVVLLAAALAVAVFRLELSRHGVSGLRTACGLDTHCDGLLLGAAAAYAVRTLAQPLTTSGRRAWAGAAYAGAAVLVVLLTRVPSTTRAGAEWGYAAAALATSAVVLGLALGAAPGLGNLLDLRPLRWLGRRSYGLYLWHPLVFTVLSGRRLGPVPATVVATSAALLVATASYRWVERPFLALRGPSAVSGFSPCGGRDGGSPGPRAGVQSTT